MLRFGFFAVGSYNAGDAIDVRACNGRRATKDTVFFERDNFSFREIFSGYYEFDRL